MQNNSGKQWSLGETGKVWAAVALLLPLYFSAPASKCQSPLAPKYDRASNLVINLNTQVGSSGFYLLKSLSDVKTIDHDLGKAALQVSQVDKTYAKLRGRPDDRYLNLVNIKIQKALETRKQLELDLRDAYEQLKESIQDTIMTDEERKKKPKSKTDKGAKDEYSSER